MDFIATIFSSPLPVAVSAVIAVSACAGYWFFVIPLLEEVKVLRVRNKELQDNLEVELRTHFKDNSDKMDNLATSIASCDIKDVSTKLSELKAILEAQNSALIHSIEVNINQVHTILGNVETQLKSEGGTGNDKIRGELSSINKLLDDIASDVDDISDKQSQVTGILTGMSIAQSMNRSL